MGRGITFVLVFGVIILAVDYYSFQAVKLMVENWSPSRKRIFYTVYWAFSFTMIGVILFSSFYGSPSSLPTWVRVGVITPVFIVFFSKIILVLFLLIDDLRRGGGWLIEKMTDKEPYNLSRNKFITSVGLLIGGSLLSSLLYGIVKGAYNYTVHKSKITFKNLPESFKGFKIVQISDMHIGSFVSERPLEKAFSMINDLNPDLILFTGDLVNNVASETTSFHSTLKKLKATHGVFSVLGNHDYGDYVQWDSKEAKEKNLSDLLSFQSSFGWKVLMDETVKIEKDNDYINLIGIQNWGAKARFPKYGDLRKATKGIDNSKVSILMSHDPSHWEAQVLKEFKEIDLMLSGHTHGMQFGIEIPGWIKWSPIKYMYKQWAGLYENGKQKLYVNRGLGFLGYPGRVGISPEITLLELEKA